MDFSWDADQGEFFDGDNGAFDAEQETEGAEPKDCPGAEGVNVRSEGAEVGASLRRDVDVHA